MSKDDDRPPSGAGLPKHLARSDDVFGLSAPMPDGAADDDAIKRWGRRIGRGLAILVAVLLIALLLWPHPPA